MKDIAPMEVTDKATADRYFEQLCADTHRARRREEYDDKTPNMFKHKTITLKDSPYA